MGWDGLGGDEMEWDGMERGEWDGTKRTSPARIRVVPVRYQEEVAGASVRYFK